MKLSRMFLVTALVFLSHGIVNGQTGIITLDHVIGLAGNDSLATGQPITFAFRLTNNTGSRIFGSSNGFRVFSPSGAIWTNTTGSFTGAITDSMYDGGRFVNTFSINGSGADTIGFAGFRLFGQGIPVGFDAIAFEVTIGPIDSMYVGHTICIDSSFYPPSNIWVWSLEPSTTFHPDWDGPHCFAIKYAEPVVVEGRLSVAQVDGQVGPNTIATGQPIRFHIRTENLGASDIQGFTNGFKVFSPNGAQWGTTILDTVPGAYGSQWFDGGIFLNQFSITGSGADTVGVGGFGIFGTGLPSGYDGITYTIDIGPIDSAFVGKMICLDSSFYPPGGAWLWSNGQGAVYPAWSGPHCYEIAYVEPPQMSDSLIVPSVSQPPCQALQPVATKLTQPIKGASIPLAIPPSVIVDSISFTGLITEDWEYQIAQIKPDSGFIIVGLANSHGEVIPEGINTLFRMHLRTNDAACMTSSYLNWFTALDNDPTRRLLFSDTSNNDLAAAYNPARDSLELFSYLPGDFDGDNTHTVSDLTYVVDFIFHGGPPACVRNAGDPNSSCTGPNIADVTFMVDFIFLGGNQPGCGCMADSLPPSAKLSPDLLISSTYEDGSTKITLSSPTDLRGLQLVLKGEGKAPVENLLREKLDLLYGYSDGVLTVGLVDLDGSELITSGTQTVISISGQYDLYSAMGSDRQHRDIGITVTAKLDNIPSSFALRQNYPNPFNPVTQIGFDLPKSGHVRLDVFNVIGQRVVTLLDQQFEAGFHTFEWDAKDAASGLYFYRLQAGSFIETKKMMLLK